MAAVLHPFHRRFPSLAGDSTGIFVYSTHLVIVMADDSPIFEGRVPFPVKSIHDVILRLLYQTTMHFEGHLKAINMLADSLERRITRLWKTNIFSACSRSKRASSIFSTRSARTAHSWKE